MSFTSEAPVYQSAMQPTPVVQNAGSTPATIIDEIVDGMEGIELGDAEEPYRKLQPLHLPYSQALVTESGYSGQEKPTPTSHTFGVPSQMGGFSSILASVESERIFESTSFNKTPTVTATNPKFTKNHMSGSDTMGRHNYIYAPKLVTRTELGAPTLYHHGTQTTKDPSLVETIKSEHAASREEVSGSVHVDPAARRLEQQKAREAHQRLAQTERKERETRLLQAQAANSKEAKENAVCAALTGLSMTSSINAAKSPDVCMSDAPRRVVVKGKKPNPALRTPPKKKTNLPAKTVQARDAADANQISQPLMGKKARARTADGGLYSSGVPAYPMMMDLDPSDNMNTPNYTTDTSQEHVSSFGTPTDGPSNKRLHQRSKADETEEVQFTRQPSEIENVIMNRLEKLGHNMPARIYDDKEESLRRRLLGYQD